MAATLTKQQRDELACTYAALILHDENIANEILRQNRREICV
jgi:hypothetical protein